MVLLDFCHEYFCVLCFCLLLVLVKSGCLRTTGNIVLFVYCSSIASVELSVM